MNGIRSKPRGGFWAPITFIVLLLGTVATVTAFASKNCKVKRKVPCVAAAAPCTVEAHTGYILADGPQVWQCADGSPGRTQCNHTGDPQECPYTCMIEDPNTGEPIPIQQSTTRDAPVLSGGYC